VENLGWRSLFKIKEVCYVELVNVFYSNFTMVHGNYGQLILSSDIKGKTITFGPNKGVEILNIPNQGLTTFEEKKWLTRSDGFSVKECLRMIYLDGENIHSNMELRTNKLNIHLRLLHHIIALHMLPTGGGYARMSRMEGFLMWCIITERQYKIPSLIMHIMLRTSQRSYAILPYGIILMKIFWHFKALLEGECGTPLNRNDNI
ncbi:hypothetical protein CFOL_v3_04477, partial [Cephalotus follicularis]